ncbi:MAG: N(6)-L-threonylcarbamoyladenine synthase Kae1 [Candidatus Methylarchaceae archaeon HK01B]|nr:N(6)-L-threonylcarbamoyladenine synthase Kae1 [Candidatus Methylarchaceae archaeon HK01B]
MMKMKKVFGIESTAHTFSCSLISSEDDGIHGNILSDVRSVYTPPPGSGIHPREASRHHVEVAPKIVEESLTQAGIAMDKVDAVSFSAGPGLGPCLRVGATVARALALYYNKPLIPVNHAIGHIELAIMLTGAKDPIVLLVSGGHTLITAFSFGRWRVFGETLDLTIGQLIDQFGREVGFSSPSGPKIEELAGRSSNFIPLPYTVKGNDTSFSGILTSAKKLLQNGKDLESLCFSLQETAYAMLAEVTERALAFTEKREVLLTGGVAANRRLQEMLGEVSKRHSADLLVVPKEYSGDCGAQIAWTGLLAHLADISVEVEKSFVKQSWRLDRVDVKWRD